MLRLQAYLTKELLTQFVLVLLLVTGVFFAGMVLQFLHRFPEVGVVGVFKAAPAIVPLALVITLPLAFLVACLLTYGRFSDDNEFLALRMGGIHPWNAVAPALVVGVLLSLASLWLNTTQIPLANMAAKEIGKDQLVQLQRFLENPARNELELGKVLHLSWDGRDGVWLRDVLITYEDRNGAEDGGTEVKRVREITARRGHLRVDEEREVIVLDLRDVDLPLDRSDGRPGRMTAAEHQVTVPFAKFLERSPFEKLKDSSEMRASELLYRIRHGVDSPPVRREFEAEYWRRIALGLVPLVFALLGAPLGLVAARGSRMAALVTALVVALPVYYPLLLWGENLARDGTLPAPLALGLADVVMAATGIHLLGRAGRA